MCYNPIPIKDPRICQLDQYCSEVKYIIVPCGKCIDCQYKRVRDWVTRCIHQTKESHYNIFITLTYNDEHLPLDNNLSIYELQLFIKRLRKKFTLCENTKIKYYACGEYGSSGTKRPHYHLILFNLKLENLRYYSQHKGNKYYTHPDMDTVWGKGMCLISEVTEASIAYVASYTNKKLRKQDVYAREVGNTIYYHTVTGEIRTPEFATRSQGLGLEFIKKYAKQVLQQKLIRLPDGSYSRIPRYYLKKVEELCLTPSHVYDTYKEEALEYLKNNPYCPVSAGRCESFKYEVFKKFHTRRLDYEKEHLQHLRQSYSELFIPFPRSKRLRRIEDHGDPAELPAFPTRL
jgi:hypothetical protein